MILAEKIVLLRKKNGWSQEDLADLMNVSRQAVSKWESGTAAPSIDNIAHLSRLFNVSTDYLIIDDASPAADEIAAQADCPNSNARFITKQEAETYLCRRKHAAKLISIGVLLSILSPVTLLVLSILSDSIPTLSNKVCLAAGFAALFALLLCAIPLFVYSGIKSRQFDFLNQSEFYLDGGTIKSIKEKVASFSKAYLVCNTVATCLCVFAVLPLIFASLTENNVALAITIGTLLLFAGIGATLFTYVGVRNASMKRLLKEDEYSSQNKNKNRVKEAVGSAYWCILTAIFLTVSFLTNAWNITWLIFAVGGIIFPVVMYVCDWATSRTKR